MSSTAQVAPRAQKWRFSSCVSDRAVVVGRAVHSKRVSRRRVLTRAVLALDSPSTPTGLERSASLGNDVAREAAIEACMEPPEYDAVQIRKKYLLRPLTVTSRTIQIVGLLGSFGFEVLGDKLTGQLDKKMSARAVQFRNRLTSLGPTFIKVGQALSTRPDLLPQIYLDELTELQDALPCFDNEVAFKMMEEDLGKSVREMFASITPQPIAAASLGQVYKATLFTGEEVAVKVQRPNIIDGIELDIFLVRMGASLVDKYLDSLKTSLVGLVDEFATRVFQELNYVQEGLNAERFASLYGDRLEVFVPGIHWEASSTRVLTMEWVEGIKLSEQEAIARQGLDIIKLVDIGINCSLRQLLEHGFFHADPHPGNLLATPDGRLAFLDFGMMSETPPTARYAIINHVVHLVNRDYDAMARDYYALDFLDRSVDVRPIVPALAAFFDDVLEASVSELNFKTITDGLGAVLYQYPFNVPAYYALILRSLTVLEGLALFTDPNFKVIAKAYPYMARRLLTDPNESLRDALKELLFSNDQFRWGRLENLLREGGKSADYNARDVIKPMLDLVLEDTEENTLRPLIEAETIRVIEALVLGAAIEGTRAPALEGLTASFTAGGGTSTALTLEEERQVMELREQVLRVWALLTSSKGFDPAVLRPLLQLAQERKVQEFGERITNGLFTKITARAVRDVLRRTQPPKPDATSKARA